MDSFQALDRLASYFDRRPNRHGLVARRLLGRAVPGDQLLAEHLLGLTPGSARGGAGMDPAALAGLGDELVELGAPPAILDPVIARLLTFAGQPGAFGEGCTAARHAHRVCEHFLGGFFSPAPAVSRVAPVTLPNGKVYRVESQARFGLSCWMLGIVVRSGRTDDAKVQRHLDSFGHLIGEWEAWTEFLPPDLAFAAIGALAAAGERWRPILDSLFGVVEHHQLPDGTWPRVDFFNALDGLSRVDAKKSRPALVKVLPGLLQRQRDDGSFGNLATDERAMVALRVLRIVTAG